MSKRLNQKGLTLVELLAVLVIISLFLLMIGGIHLNSKEQHTIQTEKNNQLNDISYVLKVITRDMRKSTITPEINGNTIKIGSEEYVFDAASKSITRNSTVIAHHITGFKIEKITKKKYSITINSTNESINTEIVLRSGA